MILDEIGKKYNTDKSSFKHNYLHTYDKVLSSKKDLPLNFLEIGVLNGASFKMWREYLTNANIVGMDIDPNCKIFENLPNKQFIEIGSQSDITFLQNLSNKYNGFDVVLDDGSHFSDDQILTFEILFPRLKSNGIYIIEDLHCGYEKNYGGHGIAGIPNSSKISNQNIIIYLKTLIDLVNCEGAGAWQERLSIINRKDNSISSLIKSISFYTSTCIIERF